jgi:tetratricopeptide (TPR) repeat protein
MLLVNFRPEYRAEWMQRSYYLQLPLAPLGPDAIAELLRDLLGEDESLAGLHDLTVRHTEGNPFFIEEVVHALVESGALEGTPGRYRLVEPIERIEVPGTVQAVLAARIDRLPEREKQALQTAAVIGRSFGESTLERVADLPGSDLVAALAALQAAEFVRQEALYPRAEYAFRHPLTHQVAYESQLGERRARVHGEVARALEEEHAASPEEYASLLAHHWECAGDALPAARWHRRAAEWAGLRKPEEALRHWRSCGELVAGLSGSPEADSIRLAFRRGIILCASLMLPVADEELESAFRDGRSLAERSGDLTALAMIVFQYGAALWVRRRLLESLSFLDESIEIADRTGDRGLRAATRAQSTPRLLAGRLEEVRVRTEEGLDLVDGDPDLGSEHYEASPLVALTLGRGCALCALGHLHEGSATLDQALRLERQREKTMLAVMGHSYSAMYSFRAGDLDRGMRDVRELASIAEKEEAPAAQIVYRISLGNAHLAREEWEEAVRALEPVARIGVGLSRSLAAEAYLGYGDHSRARTLAEQAVTEHRERGELTLEIGALRTLAQVLRTIDAAGEIETIEASLSRAENLAREAGERFSLPSIHEERARLAQVLHDPEEAKHYLREAHRLWSEIGAPAQVERLARELAGAET